MRSAIGACVAKLGGLHVLFNNAGIFPERDGSPVDTPEEVWAQVIDVNLKGVFLGCKWGIPAMLESGPVNTPLLAEFLSDPDVRARRLVHIPMGRLAEAGEIARAALFLASPESSYVNGATFLVDGGITAAYVTPE